MEISIENSDNYSTNSQNSLMDNSEKQIPINKIVHNITEEKISIKDTTPEIKIIKTEELLVLTPEEERNIFRIKNYLKEGLERGFSINLLRQKLMESKFNDKEVNEAVKRVKNEFFNKKKQIYIIEHLEQKLWPWCVIEYKHISKIAGKNNLWFTNIKKRDIKRL